jgi:hypothetical protein
MTALDLPAARKIRRNTLKKLETGAEMAPYRSKLPPARPLRRSRLPSVIAIRDSGDVAILEPQTPRV